MQKRIHSIAFVLFMSIILTVAAAGAVDVLSTTVPVCFVQNDGQADEQVLFLANSPGYTLFLTADGQIMAPADAAAAVAITYPGAGTAVVTGEGLLPGKTSYFLGNDPDAWVTNVPMYSTVRYAGLYDGITLYYYGGTGILKREFVVGPGADPSLIRMEYAGQESLALDPSGTVLIGTSAGALFETAPVCFQVVDGERVDVACQYVISDSTVTFAIGDYDTSLPLVIDPVLDFSTYFGGDREDIGTGIALDKNGYIYIVGSTQSTNLPLANHPPLYNTTFGPVYGQLLNGSWDVFVAVVDPNVNPSQLLFSSYIGGNSTDRGTGIAVNDTTGMVTITGYTDSLNFPSTTGPAKRNFTDVFVTRFDRTASVLTWSTYLGGNQTDEATAIALNSTEYTIVVGRTDSSDFDGLDPLYPHAGGWDGFVAVVDGSGALTSGRYLGGSMNDYVYGVAIGASDVIWVTGSTLSSNFPNTWPVVQPSKSGKTDAFITSLDSAANNILLSTFIGALGDDIGRGIAVDANGYIYITGSTDSSVSPLNLFPARPGAFQQTYGGGTSDAFVTKMNPTLTSYNYSTYLGGNKEDRAYAIALDDMGNAYITGWTLSTNFPTELPLQAPLTGLAPDVIVTILNDTGKSLLFSSYLGGTYYDEGRAIAITPDGLNITLTGYTESINFPLENALWPYLGGYQPVLYEDAFITRIVKVPPVANFTAFPTKGCTPLNVSFYDNSTGNPTQWFWEFGDGNTSTNQSPFNIYSHTEATKQNYTVNLTVWNSDGTNFTNRTDFITVCPNPFANFTADETRGCVGSNATFLFNVTEITGQADAADFWNWSFGDGNYMLANNTTMNVTYAYPIPGNFTVSLTYGNDCCNNTTVKEGYMDIRAIPVADFYTTTPTSGLIPLKVNFSDNSTGRPSAWNWTFGAGEGNSSLQNTSHIYTTKGHFDVTLEVCNFCGCDTALESDYIKVGDPRLFFDVGKTIVLPNGTFVIPTNDTTPLYLFLEEADSGLSGYDLYLRFGDVAAGNITPPTWFPQWAAINTTTPLPGPDVTIVAVDLTGTAVPIGAKNVTLAWFNLTGLEPMEVWFNVTPNQIDDRFDKSISTSSEPAQLKIVRLLPFPGENMSIPIDPDGDQLYWDVTGDGQLRFLDVIVYFQNMQWIQNNQYIPFFDYTGGEPSYIGFGDVISLFHKVGGF
ncbi:MAG: PKD domain-containing protein [Methanoregulaceae archaeon]|jgi:PKD repeat protein